MIRKRQSLPPPVYLQRLLALADVRGPDECWVWQGSLNKDGYGNFRYHGKTDKAHRASFIEHGGVLLPGQSVRHTCDNRPCINPAHLEAGSHQDNMLDRSLRGRSSGGRKLGVSNNFAKLSEHDVVRIFQMEGHYADIAFRFNVTDGCVRQIKTRKTWKHITANL